MPNLPEGSRDVSRTPEGVPEIWRLPQAFGGSYHPGWLGPDGTLHAVDGHYALKPRGYITANRRHITAERARRRLSGSPYRFIAPLGNYGFCYGKGFLRLEVRPERITRAEYSIYQGANETPLPNLSERITAAQAQALANLCKATDSGLQVSGVRTNPNGKRQSFQHDIYSPHDPAHILQEVHAHA